jgi:hypothetical protein
VNQCEMQDETEGGRHENGPEALASKREPRYRQRRSWIRLRGSATSAGPFASDQRSVGACHQQDASVIGQARQERLPTSFRSPLVVRPKVGDMQGRAKSEKGSLRCCSGSSTTVSLSRWPLPSPMPPPPTPPSLPSSPSPSTILLHLAEPHPRSLAVPQDQCSLSRLIFGRCPGRGGPSRCRPSRGRRPRRRRGRYHRCGE